VTAIVTSLLGGGWELVAGWILPTAINTLFFAFLVLPALRGVPAFHAVLTASHPAQALALLVIAVVGGLALSAMQTPLYRVLEGYNWPAGVRRRRIDHHRRARQLLDRQLRLAQLTRREQVGTLTPAQADDLAELRRSGAGPQLPHSSLDISVLAERLRRYPVDLEQILPTRLGNAIRRFEEYGYDRYRLDIITMWYALYGVSATQVRREVGAGRASADFFVCLIYGHVAVALAAVAALAVHPSVGPAVAIAIAAVLSVIWYWMAVRATDEWAAAVRGLVDLGRKPLAEALGLCLPGTLEQERKMWALVSRRSRIPHGAWAAELDEFRARMGERPRAAETESSSQAARAGVADPPAGRAEPERKQQRPW
jgi:hypothetical protein